MPTFDSATPRPARAHSPERVVADTFSDLLDGVEAGLTDPTSLFSKDYDLHHGQVADLPPPITMQKRAAPPRKNGDKSVHSPSRKKVHLSSSPRRPILARAKAIAAVTLAAATSVIVADKGTDSPLSVPEVTRKGPSPKSADALPLPAIGKKKRASPPPSKIGHIPKSSFLPWMRKELCPTDTFSQKEKDKQLRDRRGFMLCHFSKHGSNVSQPTNAVSDGRVTRSAVAEDEEWLKRLELHDPIRQRRSQRNQSMILLVRICGFWVSVSLPKRILWPSERKLIAVGC